MSQRIKIGICLIIALIFSINTYSFASATEKYEFSSIINSFDFISDSVKQNLITNQTEKFNNAIIENDYLTVIYTWQSGIDYIYFYFYNTNSTFVYNNTENFSSWNPSTNYTCYRITVSNGYVTNATNLGTNRNGQNNGIYGIYSETGFETNIYTSFSGKGTYGQMLTTNWDYIDGYKPLPAYPQFEFSQDIISDFVTINNGTVNKTFNGFNKSITIDAYHSLGSLYLDTPYLQEELMSIQIFKFDFYADPSQDYLREIYNNSELVNGTSDGYLKYNSENNGIHEYLVYYPKSFMEANYIYTLSIKDINYNSVDVDPFVILNISTPGGIITSGDTNSIIQDQETVTPGDITGSINDVNNSINNLGDTINDAILGEENASGDREGGLLGGIIDGIKGLFIPEANFFSDYFNELNDWFGERLGLLYFPIELLLDFFDRVTSIDFEKQILSIGPFTMPLNDDYELVPKIEFDFKTFVEDENIKTVYDIYLIIVDGLIIFGLSQLIRIKYEEVFGS